MFHPASNTTPSSSFYLGGIDALAHPTHPHAESHSAIDLGDDSRLASMQWMTSSECASPQYLGENMQLMSNIPSTLPSPAGEGVFSFRSTSSESSPHMSHLAVSDGQSTNADSCEYPGNGEGTQKTTLRRSQNRQAQRRFRERKEQQKASLLAQLETLQSKHDKMTDLLDTMRQNNTTLESDRKRLEREVETLRTWREKVLSVMENIVKPDGAEDDLLMKVATSCSAGCWRRGIEYSKTVIVMQTLLGLFGEKADTSMLGLVGLDGNDDNDIDAKTGRNTKE
ncbi:hypothetical protein BDV12DRAFT_177329 [Aspergillus spectabilis]